MNFFSYRNKDHIINECEDGEDEYHGMREWLEDLYSNTKLRKPLKRKLLILFMNNKALFLEKGIEEETKNDTKTIETIGQNRDDSDTSDVEELDPELAKKYTMSKMPLKYQLKGDTHSS
jgi:hypothetical protein